MTRPFKIALIVTVVAVVGFAVLSLLLFTLPSP